jgi:iron complex transport system substrate-binding protein
MGEVRPKAGKGALALALTLGAALAFGEQAHAGPRVVSLDQCADQYVLALAPRADIAGLSHRALAPDSYLAQEARGLPVRRASLESVLASRPDVVVRYWGGDELMARRLQARGVRVVKIDDAADFEGVRGDVRRVAAALERAAAGEALIGRMDAELSAARGAWGGRRALYFTPGGFTAGPDTLVGAMMAAAGLRNAAPSPGFTPVRLERLAIDPPDGFVLGFFDPASIRSQHWSITERGALKRIAAGRTLAVLPGAVLGCPAWFAADGAAALARAARGRP